MVFTQLVCNLCWTVFISFCHSEGFLLSREAKGRFSLQDPMCPQGLYRRVSGLDYFCLVKRPAGLIESQGEHNCSSALFTQNNGRFLYFSSSTEDCCRTTEERGQSRSDCCCVFIAAGYRIQLTIKYVEIAPIMYLCFFKEGMDLLFFPIR